jgi:hypothetical protein
VQIATRNETVATDTQAPGATAGRLREFDNPDEEAAMRMIGIVVLAVGILALVYGGFSYTRETHDVKLGPVEFSVKEKERVNVPLWAGVALAVVGAGVLISGKK